MQTWLDDLVNRDARFDVGAALLAGLVGGGIAWLLSHGIPWFTSGMVSPELMGRDLSPAVAAEMAGNFGIILAQIVLGLCYAFIIAPLVTHLRGMWALGLGALLGCGLYALNFCVFHFLLGVNWSGTELPVIVTHVVFGVIVAGVYKGLAARRFASVG